MANSKAISRISQMEALFDAARAGVDALEKEVGKFKNLRDMMERLEAYYTSADWKKDFALDEGGMLPLDLKRGVLSEDGIYDLLERYRDLKEALHEC